jgi:hypothetical protein
MRRALEILVSAVLGAVVATVGAIAHRGHPPVGVVLCALLALFATVFVRAWSGWTGVIALAVPFVALSFVFTRPGPGGSLLIAGDGLGYSWLYAAAGAVIIACLLPSRLLGGGHDVASS